MSAIDYRPDGSFVCRFYDMAIGYPLGGKAKHVVTCPKCGRGAWRKSASEFVHESVTVLRQNEPHVEPLQICKLAKNELHLADKTKEKAKKK